jgi:hypothetical protein
MICPVYIRIDRYSGNVSVIVTVKLLRAMFCTLSNIRKNNYFAGKTDALSPEGWLYQYLHYLGRKGPTPAGAAGTEALLYTVSTSAIARLTEVLSGSTQAASV